jgi:HPt (histidine-containing phosphotransfer) domain-containing protein
VTLMEYDEKEILNRTVLLIRLEDEELCEQLITLFVAEFPVQMDLLKIAVSQGDRDSAERLAHTIKGAAANIEARLLSKTTLEIESAAREGNIEGASGLLEGLEREFERLKRIVERK